MKTYVETGGNIEKLSDIVENVIGTVSLILGGSEDGSGNGGLDCCARATTNLLVAFGKKILSMKVSVNDPAKILKEKETRGKVN
jgi:hypothetical protein